MRLERMLRRGVARLWGFGVRGSGSAVGESVHVGMKGAASGFRTVRAMAPGRTDTGVADPLWLVHEVTEVGMLDTCMD